MKTLTSSVARAPVAKFDRTTASPPRHLDEETETALCRTTGPAWPASTHENRASELMLKHLTRQYFAGRIELVLVDRGLTEATAPHAQAAP